MTKAGQVREYWSLFSRGDGDMDKELRVSRLNRFTTKFARPLRRSFPAPQSTSMEPSITITATEPYDDHARTQLRYEDAVSKLKDALQHQKDCWESFDLGIPEAKVLNFEDVALQSRLNAVLKAHEKSIKDRKGWNKFTHAVESTYTIFSPLAKNILTVGINIQSIPILNPYGLVCGGLFLLIADKEIGRKKEIIATLDYLCQQIGLLDVTSSIPEEIEQREVLLDRSLDVRTACMLFVAAHIRHNATMLGIFGRVSKTILKGNEELEDVNTKLKSAIESYNKSLANIHIRIDLKTYELVKGLRYLNIQSDRSGTSSEDHFIVPFEQNPNFTGRKDFLGLVKQKLSEELPKKYNHRVALYGMGGIGKTQIAIEYIYANRDFYEQIYWITAVDQTSLLLEYRNIAERVGLKAVLNLTPIAIAQEVLRWLSRKSNSLIVLDNLDNIAVASELLPPTGPQRHTLITTRNPNVRDIPAEGLETPLFGERESLELLYLLSDITLESDDPDNAISEALEIVHEFGYLPLGIAQAAAFVCKVTGDFQTFIKEYTKNRKAIHSWFCKGNQSYPRSIAATLLMSLSIVREQNMIVSELFQILSFLNPDNIRIDFLQEGAESLRTELKRTLSDRIELSTALIELENFSLLRWNRSKKTLTIHRLVQTVVKDEMSETKFRQMSGAVIDLSARVFPEDGIEIRKKLPTLREYGGQFSTLLLDPKILPSSTLVTLMSSFGRYLMEDGKANIGESFLRRACQLAEEVYEPETREALRLKVLLSACYRLEGKLTEATSCFEALLEKQKRLWGEDDLDTLDSLACMAGIFYSQGRLRDSVALLEGILQRQKRVMGEEHPNSIATAHGLAVVYSRQSRYVEAMKLYEPVLEKRRRLFGEEHLDTMASLPGLSFCYLSMGRWVEALDIQEQVLKKRKQILGEEHPVTLATMYTLVGTQRAQGNTKEAVLLCEEVVKKQRKILGDLHHDTQISIYHLAYMYDEFGREEEAANLRAELKHNKSELSFDELCDYNLIESYGKPDVK